MAEELDYVPMPDKVVKDDQEDVGDRDQGRERQAAVRRDELISVRRERAPIGAFSYASASAEPACGDCRTA